MNLRVDVFFGNYHECGKDGEEGNTNLLFAQYGLQEDIKDEWKNIISIDESKRFMMEIDNLVNKMESNSKKNGFFDFKQNINTESLAGFKLDDKDLYYLFFVIVLLV